MLIFCGAYLSQEVSEVIALREASQLRNIIETNIQ